LRRLCLALLPLAAAAGDEPPPEEALSRWLEAEGVKGDDLVIRDRELLRAHEASRAFFRDPEPFLLPAVRDALDRPLGVAPRWRAVTPEGGPRQTLLRLHPAPVLPSHDAKAGPPTEGLGGLDPEVARAVDSLVQMIAHATRAAEAALARLTAEERAEVAATLPRWITRTRDEDAEALKAGKEDEAERDALLRCAALLGKADGDALYLAWLDLCLVVEGSLETLARQPPFTERIRLDTQAGPVLLLGTGNDGGAVDAALVIDFGGDDEHRFPKDAAARPVRVFLDLAGNDLCLGEAPLAFGGALLGLSLHVDAKGDDDYRAQDWGLGAALGGHAALVDLDGDDRYHGGLGVEGAAAFGTALLWDRSGSDSYVCGCFGQGFGTTGGTGALVDALGDDTYFAGRDQADLWRRAATYVTFAQGAAFGHRFGHVYTDEGERRWRMTGQLPGGLGLLLDAEGDDRYDADVFGQGAGYWYGLGVLVDRAGNDRYRATWYGQGVGTHAAVGCVVDLLGDDRYGSRNTSQGCGHDFSAGILWDEEGDDTYHGWTLCQGAGNAASGLGLLLDGRGADLYRCSGSCWGFGAGETRRPEAAPFGLFLDLGGSDRFEGAAPPGAARKQGARGHAADRP
jgi:hypothetical protein